MKVTTGARLQTNIIKVYSINRHTALLYISEEATIWVLAVAEQVH